MPEPVDIAAFAVLTALSMTAAVTDWRTEKVPNWLTGLGMLAGLVLGAARGAAVEGWPGVPWGVGSAVAGLLAGLIPFAVLFFMGGLGGGDVKLMGAVGAILASITAVLHTAIYAIGLAAIMATIVMVRHRLIRRTLGRLISAAMSAAAKTKPAIPEDDPRVPFAVAIALGSLLAGADFLLGVRWPWDAWMG